MSSILVTGASGAVGVPLCRHLGRTDHEVVGVDRRTPRWDIEVPFERMDLNDAQSLPNIDVIIHLAAHSRVPPTVEEPTLGFGNVTITEPVLEHARKNDARVVFASSREVYGNAVEPHESAAGLDAVNPYGASKQACEAFCNSYYNCYDVPVTILRLSNVYGPYETNTRVVPIFIALATEGEELPVYGAQKTLDFVHVDDVVRAFRSVLDSGSTTWGETINVGSGTGTSLSTLAEKISRAVSGEPNYRVESERDGEVDQYVADISKARGLLGWEPTVSFVDGLSETIDWYRDHEPLLAEIRSSI